MKRTSSGRPVSLQPPYSPSLPLPYPYLLAMSPSVTVLPSTSSANRPSPWFAGWRPPSSDSKSSLCTANGEKKKQTKKQRANPASADKVRQEGNGMIGEFVGFNGGSEGERRPWGRWYLAKRLQADKRNCALVMWYTESPVYLVYPPSVSILCG